MRTIVRTSCIPSTRGGQWRVCSAIVLALGLVGCGGGGEEVPAVFSNLVNVTGKVTLDGEPLVGAAISFIPDGQDAVRGAYGLTTDTGEYTLITPVKGRSAEENAGAVPGHYKVMINKLLMPDGSEPPADRSHADQEGAGAREIIPVIYSDPEQTVLASGVGAWGEQTGDFELKSK